MLPGRPFPCNQAAGRSATAQRAPHYRRCCNGDGSDNLLLWIIGHFKKPRCFKNININNLGCTYRSNAKGWMTQINFLEWLKDFDSRMVNRHVLLILDNCSAHVPLAEMPDRIQLKSTSVYYLPQNTTLKLQPCDAGIIRNLKAYYQRSFNRFSGREWRTRYTVPTRSISCKQSGMQFWHRMMRSNLRTSPNALTTAGSASQGN